jgi:DNA-binding LytR/AlgR family response regulator
MTEAGIKILIVEDDMLIAANIALQLTKLGYEVAGIIPTGEEAIHYLEDTRPDIILLDISLRGAVDGIEVAGLAKMQGNIPVIFLTANSDETTFNRAKATQPYAFISKPFKKLDLQRAIELTISRMAEQQTQKLALQDKEEQSEEGPFILSDRIFVRQKEKMVKIYIQDILFAEADRNYCRIYTPGKEYLLATPLKSLEEKLPAALFLRIHRSRIINVSKIDSIGEQFAYISIGQQTLAVSSSCQDALAQRLKTI